MTASRFTRIQGLRSRGRVLPQSRINGPSIGPQRSCDESELAGARRSDALEDHHRDHAFGLLGIARKAELGHEPRVLGVQQIALGTFCGWSRTDAGLVRTYFDCSLR